MQEIAYHTNYKLENKYWWFVARNKIIREIVEKTTDLSPGDRVLDVGCGTGAFAASLNKKYDVACLDTSAIALDYARRRGLTELYQTTLDQFPKNGKPIRAAFILDALEHIEDDVAAIESARKILAPGGWLVATVPAYKWLWNRHDLIHMHYRRYTKKQIEQKLLERGFNIVYSSYFNTFLFAPAALKRILDKRKKIDDGGYEPVDNIPGFLDTIFRKIFLAERKFLPENSFPFGLSIITISKKT